MSASHENPNLPCQQAAGPLCDTTRAAEEERPDAASRPPKSVLLPEIVRLSLEGCTSRAISRQTAVPRQTVDRWLRQQRREWTETAEDTAGELFAIAMARLQSVYREAMHAWRRSLPDQHATVDAAGDEGKPDSARRRPQSGQASLLGKAIQAAAEIARFHARHVEAVRQAKTAMRRAKTAKRCRVRRKLAGEIASFPEPALEEIKEMLREIDCFTAPHSQDEMADILCKLSPAAYLHLRALLHSDYDVALPRRRTAVVGAPEVSAQDEGMKDGEEGTGDQGSEVREEGLDNQRLDN